MPFKPGDPNINRKGAPKRDWTWAGVLQDAVEKADAEDGRTVKEIVADSLIREAKKGNVHALRDLMNRMDGMPQQDIVSDGEAIKGPIVYIPKENEQ